SDKDIWCSIRSKDLLPCTPQFLWRVMHNAHRVGDYWKHIPECEDWAIRQTCGGVEDLEHILINCKSPGPGIIWKVVEKLWLGKEPVWPEVSLGGCGLMHFEDKNREAKPGTRRLYRILVSDSAYTIWKLRNDRVISRAGAPLTEKEIINKWMYDLNQCLQQDMILANTSVGRNCLHLAPTLVKDTWAETLDNKGNLPEIWLKESRVLVGHRVLTRDQI
ncbi:hypothetical protein K438DRAFT_1561908, partial [Mycena galopus ATCC 62051]